MKGLPELVIGDLKVKRPVIQGGMGVGVSLGQLAGAVAKEGGVGIISTAQIGFREPDFETNTRAANIRAIGCVPYSPSLQRQEHLQAAESSDLISWLH